MTLIYITFVCNTVPFKSNIQLRKAEKDIITNIFQNFMMSIWYINSYVICFTYIEAYMYMFNSGFPTCPKHLSCQVCMQPLLIDHLSSGRCLMQNHKLYLWEIKEAVWTGCIKLWVWLWRTPFKPKLFYGESFLNEPAYLKKQIKNTLMASLM